MQTVFPSFTAPLWLGKRQKGPRREKRIKEPYPHLSLLFLDFDSNTSEVNIYNRCRIFPTFV